jgi:hypothetical protein
MTALQLNIFAKLSSNLSRRTGSLNSGDSIGAASNRDCHLYLASRSSKLGSPAEKEYQDNSSEEPANVSEIRDSRRLSSAHSDLAEDL